MLSSLFSKLLHKSEWKVNLLFFFYYWGVTVLPRFWLETKQGVNSYSFSGDEKQSKKYSPCYSGFEFGNIKAGRLCLLVYGYS